MLQPVVRTNEHQQLEDKPIEFELFTSLSPKHEGFHHTTARLEFTHSLTMWWPNCAMAEGITAIDRMNIRTIDQTYLLAGCHASLRSRRKTKNWFRDTSNINTAKTMSSKVKEVYITLCPAGAGI